MFPPLFAAPPVPGRAGKGAAGRGSCRHQPCQRYHADGTLNDEFETHGFFAGIDPQFYSEPIRSLQSPLYHLEQTRFGRAFIKRHLYPILCLNPKDYPNFDADLPSFFDNHPAIAKETERRVCCIISTIDAIDTGLSDERKKFLYEHPRAESWEELAINPIYNHSDLAVASFKSWAGTMHPPYGDDEDLGECGPALIAFLAHIFPTVEVTPVDFRLFFYFTRSPSFRRWASRSPTSSSSTPSPRCTTAEGSGTSAAPSRGTTAATSSSRFSAPTTGGT